jgi:hypothetical protein
MERSAQDIKLHNVSVMGDALGRIYSELWQESARLHSDWAEFVSLFGTNPERIDLLNIAAGRFFRTVQDSLWERTLLNIARITDPAQTFRRRNLSIQSLPDEIIDPMLKDAVSLSVSFALTKCEFSRDWRNRHIAHADLDLALDATANPLKPASRKSVNEALASILDVLNSVSLPLLGTTTTFDDMVLTHSAEDLLCLIEFGLRKKEERSNRIESGNFTEDDLAELRRRFI